MGNKRKILLLICSVIIVILLAGLFLVSLVPSPPPASPLPSPNGYTSFLDAASHVQKSSLDFSKMTREQLQSFVDANSNALVTARSGLTEESRVQVEYSQAYGAKHIPELQNLKWLAYAFMAEGRLNELNQRPGDAANSYMDVIRLGIESRRGGPLIDTLVGIAIEAMGSSALEKLMGSLDAKSAGELARKLESIDAQRGTWQEALDDEHRYSLRTFPGLQYRIAKVIMSKSLKAAEVKAENHFKTEQRRTRKLTIDLAAHAYELDKGRRPANAADLVPDYLKAVPVDPVTGKNMALTP